jgi:hypothetical protein
MPSDMSLPRKSVTSMRVLILLVSAISIAAIPGSVAAQTPKCTSLLTLKPKAEALQSALRGVTYSSIDQNNCRNAQQSLSDYRSLVWQAGEICARDNHSITSFFANEALFGNFHWSTSSLELLVLACESAGVIPLRISQASCPALADYENEFLKIQRTAFKLHDAQPSAQVCREAASLERKFESITTSFNRVRQECRTAAGTPLPTTHLLLFNPASSVCTTTPPSDASWFTADDFRRWFGGVTIIIPVGLILGVVLLVIGLLRRR